MANKDHCRGAVKSRANSTQPPSLEALSEAIAQVDIDADFTIPKNPNWHRALEREDAPNPVELEVMRRFNLVPKVKEALEKVVDFELQFAELLPADAMSAWLELSRVLLSLRISDSTMHFNVGVDMGRDTKTVTEAIERAGLSVDHLSQTRLFALSCELARIARDLR